MAWLKQNLYLVAGGLIALALLGVAGFYLFTKLQADAQVTEELTLQTEALIALVNRPVHPGNDKIDNIKATQRERQRLEDEFLSPSRKLFGALEASNTVDSTRFQLSLVNTISELRRAASNSSVTIPPQYAFSFAAQERALQFDPASLGPLTMQLKDIRTICQIVYRAKVHRLDIVKRVAVATNEPADGPDYLSKTFVNIKTNEATGAVVVPYHIEVVGHSGEIAQVLNGFTQSPEFFAVKIVAIEPSTGDATQDTLFSGESSYGGSGSVRGMDPMLARRYGLAPSGPGSSAGMPPDLMRRYGLGGGGGGPGGGRYGRGPVNRPNPYVPPPPTPDQSAAPQTGPFLKETPLRLIALIEALKVPPAAETKN